MIKISFHKFHTRINFSLLSNTNIQKMGWIAKKKMTIKDEKKIAVHKFHTKINFSLLFNTNIQKLDKLQRKWQ